MIHTVFTPELAPELPTAGAPRGHGVACALAAVEPVESVPAASAAAGSAGGHIQMPPAHPMLLPSGVPSQMPSPRPSQWTFFGRTDEEAHHDASLVETNTYTKRVAITEAHAADNGKVGLRREHYTRTHGL
jgi:hypothetical protein